MIPLREYNNIDNNYVHAYSNLISDFYFNQINSKISELNNRNKKEFFYEK